MLHELSNSAYTEDEQNMINWFRANNTDLPSVIDYYARKAVSDYIAANPQTQPQKVYEIDDYTDDELYMADTKARFPDLTDEEIEAKLDTAKLNEDTFQKEVDALRAFYKAEADKEAEYAAVGVKHRLVISHNAFVHRYGSPFDIEQDVFAQWTELLRENVKPHVMVCGHAHELNVYYPENTDWNTNGSVCPVVIGSTIKKKENPVYFAGCGYIFGDDKIELVFTDSNGETVRKDELPLTR